MRTLTTNALNKTQTRLATEPVMILQINWSTGTQYYGDKTFTLDAHSVQGKLLEFSPIQATGKQDTSGEVSSASITLDDVDSTLKVLWNTIIMEGTIVTAYHHYEGNSWSDLTLVFRGKIGGTITWDEGERKLSFDIESYIDDAEVGYAPEAGEIPNLNEDAIGVMWPIVFGGVKRIKAIPVIRGGLGNNTDGIYGGWPNLEATPFEVSNGDCFPQNTNMHIVVGATRFFGYFQGNIFHRIQSNLVWFNNVTIAARDPLDTDSNNKQVVWIANGENVSKKQCWTGVANKYNYCTKQEGNKCYFMFAWDHLLDAGEEFKEVSGCVHSYWYDIPTWLNYWYIKPQCNVYEYAASTSDMYIVNEYPSSQIVEVFAKRTFDGEEIWAPVPSSYYTIHLSYSIGGRNATVIEFATPLYKYEDEQWKDDIFVSVRSTLPNNVADIIQWLVQTYTSYGIDTAAFAQARLDVAPYPANFALFTKKNVIALIEEIAWQARCAIFVHNGVISLKYLSKDMPVNYMITREDVLLKSLKLGFVPTEEIYTKLTSTWKLDYSGEELSEKKIVYSNNINLFGLRMKDADFYIYNIEELAKMSAYFWGYRYSNSWRTMNYPTVLRTLPLELFDCASHNMAILSSYIIRGILEDVSHDSVSNEISMAVQLCSKAGQHLGGQPIEDPYFWIGDPAYVVTPRSIVDPLNGLTIVDYVVPVITTNQTNTNDHTNQNDETYKFVFILPTQDEIERGVNFSVKVQLQTSKGQRSYNTVTGRLSLSSEDQADRLSGGVVEKDVVLTNGEYTGTEQITLGSTTVYNASLACSDKLLRDEYATGTSEMFSIIAAKTTPLHWVTSPPATVQRGVPFPVSINGGLLNEQIDLSAVGADTLDQIYSATAGVPITSIALDSGGAYSGNWYIAGGSGAETAAKLRLTDTRYHKYANSDSTTFNISSTEHLRQITQTFTINPLAGQNKSGGGVNVNPNKLELTLIAGTVGNGEVFTLGTRFLDINNVVINYTGMVMFLAYDAEGYPLNWLAPISSQVFNATMVNGVYLNDFALNIELLNTPPVTIYAMIMYNGVSYQASLTASYLPIQTIEQTFDTRDEVTEAPQQHYRLEVPANITRGVSFNVTIVALDANGVTDTTYTPHGTTLTPTSSDPADDVTPINVPDGGWSSGVVVQAFTLTGGAGLDTLSFTAIEPHNDYIGTSTDIGVGTSAIVIGPDWWKATWTGVGSFTGSDFGYSVAVQQAYEALQAATRVVNTGTVGLVESAISGGGSDWEYGGGDSGFATNKIQVSRYTISDPQKAGLMAMKIKVLLMGAGQIATSGQYSTKIANGTYYLHYSDVEPLVYTDLLALDLAGNGIAYGGKVGPFGTWGSLAYSYTPLAPDTLNNAFYASIDVAFLRAMTGNSLYLWLTHSTNRLDAGVGYAASHGGHTGTIYFGAGAAQISLLEIQA